jgi:hypothetical protein
VLIGSNQPALVWATVLRRDDDQGMIAFLYTLGDHFRGYMERTMAVRFAEAEPIKGQPSALGFLGVPRQMPHIQVTDPPADKGRSRGE